MSISSMGIMGTGGVAYWTIGISPRSGPRVMSVFRLSSTAKMLTLRRYTLGACNNTDTKLPQYYT